MTDPDETDARYTSSILREAEHQSIDLNLDAEEWKAILDTLIPLLSDLVDDEDFGTIYVLARELEEQESLIEDGHFASAVLRQSTLFEHLLYMDIKGKFEENIGRDLYGSEEGFLNNLSHRNQIILAHMIDVVDQKERDILLEMANWRNTVAHEWWFISERQNKKELKDTATTTKNLLAESIEELIENSDSDILDDLLEEETDFQ